MESISTIQNNKPTIKFTSGIFLKDLMSEDGTVFEIRQEDDFMQPENAVFENSSILDYQNYECVCVEDEDTYNDAEPFERLAEKMTNILDNGKIKKRLLREGVGHELPENGFVICDYNAYIEYSSTPFDSTYVRKIPHKLRLDNGEVLPGFEIAIKSMKVTEKSQFLIHPDLAYGEIGCLSRVPPNTQVLFEIEIKNCLDSGATPAYHNLTKDEQQGFAKTYEYAEALCLKGKEFFNKNLIKPAIREYKTAVSKLENCVLADYKDQEIQQKLLLKLYSNLVVAYTKMQVPKKACTNANAAYHLVKGTTLKVPIKVYFNNARALMMLGDFDSAKQKLLMAKKLDPKNISIGEEFVKLDSLIEKNHEREVKLAQALFKNVDKSAKSKEVTDNFKSTLKDWFDELNNDSNQNNYTLPHNLNEKEIMYVKCNAAQYNLSFGERQGKYFIYKEA